MKILYLHMIGAFGGASRSLLEVVRALPPDEVKPLFLLPEGSAATQFRDISDEVIEIRGMSQFDNTRYSYYHGFRWLVLLRELAYLPATVCGLFQARKRWGEVDLIHVNEFTGIVPWLLARKLFSAPVVVHVRSLAREDATSLRTRWVNRLFRKYADAVIAIDENVRDTLPPSLSVQVIHNSFSMRPSIEDGRLNKVLGGLRPNSFKVGFVGNLLRVKGLFDLLEAARILQAEGLDIEYVVVGGDAHNRGAFRQWCLKKLGLAQDIQKEVFDVVQKYGLVDCVHFSDFTLDIQSAYKKMNVLCFPSHYDAPGRPIFEAAFHGVPSIVAVRKPRADTLVDGESGLAVPVQDPVSLAAAIRELALDPIRCENMGVRARELAKTNFDVATNAKMLLDVYRRYVKQNGGVS